MVGYGVKTYTMQSAVGVGRFHRTTLIQSQYDFSSGARPEGIVTIRYYPTAEMIADSSTKALIIGDEYAGLSVRLLGPVVNMCSRV